MCSKTALEKNAEINIFGKLSETDWNGNGLFNVLMIDKIVKFQALYFILWSIFTVDLCFRPCALCLLAVQPLLWHGNVEGNQFWNISAIRW